MITKVIMPKFGLSMETGVIGSWSVAQGDKVTKGCELAEITTDKISNICEAPSDGFLVKILFQEGDEVACGEPIAIIADSLEEQIPEGKNSEQRASTQENSIKEVVKYKENTDEKRITPRAKKVAEEQDLEYEHIVGTGLLGAITISDLKKYGKPKNKPQEVQEERDLSRSVEVNPVYDELPLENDDEIVKMTSMEKAISKSMHASLQTSAQITIATEADITNLVSVYEGLKRKYTNAGVKLSYTAMLVKAIAMALENHKTMRYTMADENHIKVNTRIHIGVAVDIPRGLVVPVIRDANMKDLRTICLELVELTEKAKTNKLASRDMGGATITITNLGMFGITYFTPILNLPEASIIGVGAITEKLMVKNGGFVPGSVINLSLTHDHRIINGAPAARFLKEVTNSLQDFKWS